MGKICYLMGNIYPTFNMQRNYSALWFKDIIMTILRHEVLGRKCNLKYSTNLLYHHLLRTRAAYTI